MDFDVVVATRNRPDALELSLPLLIGQSRRPSQIIVVDSSDDPAPVARLVERLRPGAGFPIHLFRSAKGLTRQRNLGLKEVSAPVVFFPDDDSLCHPGATEALMRIYERDEAGMIAGVRCVDAREPPPDTDLATAYRISDAHQREARLKHLRRYVERGIADRNPFPAMGKALADLVSAPDWLEQENAVKVGWMTGYLMSFRTGAIRATGFEEAFAGYGLFEDIDASFEAMRHGALVAAKDALIYHHRAPAGRPDPYRHAVMNLLNRGLIFAKQFASDRLEPEQIEDIRRRTFTYARLRQAGLLAQWRSSQARDDFRGTRDGIRALQTLFSLPPEQQRQGYARLARDLGID
ncbi:glycosyltransferase family 2 protein [Haematobacter missouriensis]|nr:glycosyltransferase [Haematobacter missouriensis]